MKLSRLSILAVAALSCAAFAISCESDDASALAPFWADGDVDGDALNGGKGPNGGNGFDDLNGGGAGLRGGDGFGDLNGGDGFGTNGGPGAFQPLYFPYDQNTISSSEEAKISAVAQYLLGHPEAGVVIEGYCDERGTEEYNRALGERRAIAANDMLVDVYGIESSRIKTVSYGEERPAVTGTGDAAWSKNRRDEFVPVYLKNN